MLTECTAHRLRRLGGDGQDDDPERPVLRMDHLQVLDVHTKLTCNRRDLRQHPGTVRDHHMQLGDRARSACPWREVPPGELCVVEQGHEADTVVLVDDPAHLGQPGDERVENRDDRTCVCPADVGPDGWRPGGNPGHVPETASGQSQKCSLGIGGFGRQPHDGRCGQMRHVGHHRYELVVTFGRERHQVGAETAYHGLDLRERGRIGLRGWREDPRRTGEQVRVRTIGALLLGPGHGMATHKARVRDLRDDGPLYAADVGYDELAGFVGCEKSRRHGGDGGDRRRHESDGGEMVHPERVHGSELTGTLGPGPDPGRGR